MNRTDKLYGGVEAGGTKFVCAIGTNPDHVVDLRRIATTTPNETLAQVVDFFRPYGPRLAGIGIGSFGPVDLHPESPTWGFITSTPKPGWAHTNFAGTVRDALGVRVAFDTDVNVAALGEMTWGGAQGTTDCLYITVGTGVGGGAIVGGRMLHGLVHPEMGHVRIPRAEGDPFEGACPFHGDCLEGMVSGPALRARTGRPGETLPDEHPSWAFTVHYLAHAIVNFICILSPQRIIVGGGVASRSWLLPLVRVRVQELLNGYIRSPDLLGNIDHFLTPPALGSRAGVLGALALAQRIEPLPNLK